MAFTYTWESTMGVCKPFKSNGELDITGANNILNLEVLAVAMRKFKQERNFKRQQLKTNQKKLICVCMRERERESHDTLNLAAKPSFWIIRAYWEENRLNFEWESCQNNRISRKNMQVLLYLSHISPFFTSVYGFTLLWETTECIYL